MNDAKFMRLMLWNHPLPCALGDRNLTQCKNLSSYRAPVLKTLCFETPSGCVFSLTNELSFPSLLLPGHLLPGAFEQTHLHGPPAPV